MRVHVVSLTNPPPCPLTTTFTVPAVCAGDERSMVGIAGKNLPCTAMPPNVTVVPRLVPAIFTALHRLLIRRSARWMRQTESQRLLAPPLTPASMWNRRQPLRGRSTKNDP